MKLDLWARKWNIPSEALQELKQTLGVLPTINSTGKEYYSEAGVASRVKLEAAKKGIQLWRNNVGAGMIKGGAFVRFGLANESEAMNKVIKSGDYIGIRPVLITRSLIGTVVGQFISLEIKPSGWRYMCTPRERAQLAWVNFVISMGGEARFISGEGVL